MAHTSVETLLQHFLQVGGVSTDTRRIAAGTIFFALKGARFDGNRFAGEALRQGAAFAVVDDPGVCIEGDGRFLLVADTLRALQDLGRAYRERFRIPVVGLTGSNGKTTTKELIASVLRTHFRTHATGGNFNNHIGVPLTLLAMPADTEVAVIEMGANQPGDIAELVEIARPTVGLITNVGAAHLERLGDLDGVMRTKGALFDFLRRHGGELLLNRADARVIQAAGDGPVAASYGTPESTCQAALIDNHLHGMTLRLTHQAWPHPMTVRTQLAGAYNVMNILAAVTVGQHLGVPAEKICQGIEAYAASNNRSQVISTPDFQIWMDAYNANPNSMRASIQHAFDMQQGRVALVLGDMLELGPREAEIHRQLGTWIDDLSPWVTIGIGPLMRHAVEAMHTRAHHFPDTDSAKSRLADLLQGADLVLIKGSRGLALENLLPQEEK